MKAIDVHMHPPTEDFLIKSGGIYMDAGIRYFGSNLKPFSVEEMVEEYRSADIFGIIYAWDAETNTGLPKYENDKVADIVKKYPGTFAGFCSVDPWKGKLAVRELERSVRELGLIGLKMMPAAQGFFPNERQFYPLWDKCTELQIPVVFHTGNTGLGAGLPGGGGLKLKYNRPIPFLDDLAADFPLMTIIAAHPGWPWEQELLALALHKGNVYIDLSGWKPQYIPKQVIQFANSILQDKFLFGTDYPMLKPVEWLDEFGKLNLKQDVFEKILKSNALKIFPFLDPDPK